MKAYKTILRLGESYKGYISLIASAISFSLMTVCVKHLSSDLSVLEIVFYRATISLILTGVLIWKENISPWGKNKSLLFIRGFIGTSALACIFKALRSMPLATATTIQYTYPTFISIAAWIFLKERIQRQILVAIILGWIGVQVASSSNPTKPYLNNELTPESIFFAVGGAILTAIAYVLVRKLSKEEHPLVIVYYFPLVSLFFTFPPVINDFSLPMRSDWIWIIGIGFFTQIGQVFITKGLSIVSAARAGAISYIQVVMAAIWGICFFREEISLNLIIGSLLIFAGTIVSLVPERGKALE